MIQDRITGILTGRDPKGGSVVLTLNAAAQQAAYKARFDELKATIPHTFTGFEYDFVHVWADCSPEQRRAVLEEIYEDGSLKLWLASFVALFVGRVSARSLAARVTRPERCLVVGDAEAITTIRGKLGTAGVNAEVVASVRLDRFSPRVHATACSSRAMML